MILPVGRPFLNKKNVNCGSHRFIVVNSKRVLERGGDESGRLWTATGAHHIDGLLATKPIIYEF